VTTYQALGFSAYGMLLGLKGSYSYSQTVFAVSGSASLASLLLAVLSPFLGAASDTLGNRKTPVLIFGALVAVSIALFPVYADLWWACGWFLAAQVFVQLARLCYDAQVPFIVEPKRRALVQGLSAAIGIFGSIFSIVWSIVSKAFWGPWTLVDENYYNSPKHGSSSSLSSSSSGEHEATFGALHYFLIGGAIMFLVFMVPYVFHHEKQRRRHASIVKGIKHTFSDMKDTFWEIVGDRNGICLTISWLLVIDAYFSWQTISAVAISGAVGMTSREFDYVICVALPVAFVTAILGGMVIGRWGCKVGSIIATGCFIAAETVTIFANFRTPWFTLSRYVGFLGVFFNGIGTGFLTITPRFFVIELTTPTKVAQWLGFQRVCTKISSVFSPLLYTAILNAALRAGHSLNLSWRFVFFFRLGLLTIALLVMIFGLVDPHRRYMAGERAPYPNLYEPGGQLPRDELILREKESLLKRKRRSSAVPAPDSVAP